MNIVMLGRSSAGKTTYVSLMYDLMSRGVAGFRVSADPGTDRRLRSAAEGIRQGRYPFASGTHTSYDLMLRFGGVNIFPFTWRDYRGASLSELTGQSEDARRLHDDLRTADGLVLFADAPGLLRDGPGSSDARLLSGLARRAVALRGERLTPIAIVLTKVDLVDRTDPAVLERLRAPFRPLVDAVARTVHVQGVIVPVACGPRPIGVRLPVLWMLQHGIVERATRFERPETLVEPANHLGDLLAQVDRF
ncbi:TRAFAC clade GTPase domain-containing protein [Actinoplanes sp. HUAS TT8]|uniref:TRAFAC clade GTPase domain-containing protein n=1 Tax=Actinoplanes sp. HUAS TT8 TaxID=3447453 RepID=UPI003F51FB65